MGNFQKYRSQNVGQDFFVLDFFHRRILKVDGRDGMNPQNREKNAPAGRLTCMFKCIRCKSGKNSVNLSFVPIMHCNS
jgi:hypothetical protein